MARLHFARKILQTKNFVRGQHTVSDKMAAMMKLTSAKVTIQNMNEATVSIDGFQFMDYDMKTFLPKPYAMLTFTQAAALHAHYTPLDKYGRSFRDYRTVMADRLPVIVALRLDIDKSIYDSSISKSPLDIKVTGGSIGNTSDSFEATIQTKSGLKLVQNATVLVAVDVKTRKPAPFPDWWKEKYSNSRKTRESLKFSREPTRPHDAMKYTHRVLASDVDFNGHTNNSNHLQFADGAVYHFVKRDKRLSDIKHGMLQTVEMLNSKESSEGDFLDIYIWRPNLDEPVVYVQAYKQSSFIFQLRFVYFSE